MNEVPRTNTLSSPQPLLTVLILVDETLNDRATPRSFSSVAMMTSELAGRPAVYWITKACADSPWVGDVYVASDYGEVRHCVDGLGLDKVRTIQSSPNQVPLGFPRHPVPQAFMMQLNTEHVGIVSAIYPLLTSQDISCAASRYFAEGADSLVTVLRAKHTIWKSSGDVLEPLCENTIRHRPGGGEEVFIENEAMYITSRKQLLNDHHVLSRRIVGHAVTAETCFRLDNPVHRLAIESLLMARTLSDPGMGERVRKLKLLCVDVDGTLTDGGMYYSDAGEVMKRFDTRDAAGMLRLAVERGIIPAIITAENTPIVLARARKLGLEHVYIGIKDKESHVDSLLERLGLTWEEMCFIGDDVNDLPVMRRAGFSACPADAAPEVIHQATYLCKRKGGRGAVREVCNLIQRILS